MEASKSSCCKSNAVADVRKKARWHRGMGSFFSTILLILIPKCPFCVAAYTGSILLFFDIDNAQLMPYFLHAKPILGIIILCLIIFNYKPNRTKVAIAIAGISLLLLLLITYFNIIILPEWMLYLGFLFATWYNGNFVYFYRFVGLKKQ